jgi:hypothetical protein
MPKTTAGKRAPALRREGEASCRPFPYHGRETTADLYPTLCALSSGPTRSEAPSSVAYGVTFLSGSSRVRTRSAASPMAKARAISACGVTAIRRSLEMFATLLVSPTARLTYCRVHQRAWVESLDQWMAFREPTLYGSPVTAVACDICTASRNGAEFGEGGNELVASFRSH